MGTFRNSVFLWRRSILSLLIFGFAISLAFAQERTVTGKVTSEAEGALPGVNVVLQGTVTGIMTDAQGNYKIVVPGPGAVLVFSSIGFTTQTITVGSQSTIDVVLVPAISALNEVVVTGYGTQKKREVTSSITSVKSDEFNKGSVNNPVQLIQGKVSGLSISKPGGNPNGSYDIRLRGLSTIGANLGPLVIIDGVIGGDLNNVDPNDIESINVLKDGSAAAIYGTRGSSGVILVQTKKGKKGTAVIDYNVYTTAEMVAKNTNVMNAAEWRKLSAEVGLGTDFGNSTDWFKEIEQTGMTQVHNLSMSGGTDKTSYRASINYRDIQGIMITTGNTQLNGRINITQKALNDKFTLDLNLGATERDSKYGFDNAFRYATIYNPTAPVRSDDAAYKQYDGYFQQVLFDYYNPVSILKLNTNEGKSRILNLSLKGAFEIVKGLTLDAFYSVQTGGNLGGQYLDKNDYWGGMNRNGLASRNYDNSSSRLFESTLHYLGDVTSTLNITALAGYSYQDFSNEGFYAQGGDFLTDDFTFNNLSAALDFKNGKGTITSYKNSNKLIAFFGRVNVNLNSTWFVTASARYEGSSRFGADQKWGLFPAIGGGADIAKLINVSFIDNLKLRVNYGITGNQPASSYLSLLRLGPQGNFYYNGNFVPGYSPVSNANTDLKWEKKGEFDAGFDFSVFNSKLSGSFDFYTRTTTDLLFLYNVPVPPNLYSQAWLNLGKIKSSGLELSLNYNVIKKGDLSYSVSLTPSYILENTLVSLSGTYNGSELKYGKQELSDMGSPGQNGTPLTLVEEGKPIGQIFTWKYKEIDSDGKFVFEDTNGDGSLSPADRVVTGNGLPKFLIGFGNTVTYKNWDLNVFFRGVFGHDLVNSFRAFYEVPAYITSYNLPKTAADIRSADGKLLAVTSGTLSSKYVENADFVSLDNLALGYNFSLPKSSAFSKIRLYVAGNNLFYITKYTGVDPNPRYVDSDYLGTHDSPLVPGIDRRDTWFRTRSVTFGANFVF
ncbi:MAG: SusC/RagA family TonB-linked outer membrane protein [Bacteroidetes bacterium]|nr:MAG: SusC/RagA family TonB-linked outer membrane protein [Bacteroidota bacterium]